MKSVTPSGKPHGKQMTLCALVALSADMGLSEIRNPVLEPVVWTPVTTNDVSVRADAPSGFYIVAPQR